MAEKKFRNAMLFEYLGNILTNKSFETYDKHISSEDFERDFSSYMVINYLSMCQNRSVRDIILDNQVVLERMPQRLLYKFLLLNVPQQRNSFIKYLR